MISQFIHNVYIASVYTTLFTLIFIFLRKLIIKSVGAQWNYYLWFIVFIPWIVVWLPLSILSDSMMSSPLITNELGISKNLQYLHFSFNDFSPVMLFAIWLFGVILYAIFILFRHFKFVASLKLNSYPLGLEKQNAIKKALVNKNLIPLHRIYLSNEIVSPLICHIFKSKIYLPLNFLHDYTSSEQKYVLQHECVHYHRCDLIANTAMLVLICLNWFNLVVLFSYRYFRSAQELSCDAVLSQHYSSLEKKAYGYALLKSSFNDISQTSSMNCWWNSGAQIKERCAMLKFHQQKPIRNFIGLVVLLVLASFAVVVPNFENYQSGMKLSNSSKYPIAFSIDGSCSREIGMIHIKSVKMVSKENIIQACQKNLSNCEMLVYTTSDCSGEPIASLIVDAMGWGVMSIRMLFSNHYHISANGFNLFFDGPWI